MATRTPFDVLEDATALGDDLSKLTTELRDWLEARDPSGDEENHPALRELLEELESASETLGSLCYDQDIGNPEQET